MTSDKPLSDEQLEKLEQALHKAKESGRGFVSVPFQVEALEAFIAQAKAYNQAQADKEALCKELTQLAKESKDRELALAKLEFQVKTVQNQANAEIQRLQGMLAALRGKSRELVDVCCAVELDQFIANLQATTTQYLDEVRREAVGPWRNLVNALWPLRARHYTGECLTCREGEPCPVMSQLVVAETLYNSLHGTSRPQREHPESNKAEQKGGSDA